MDSVVTDAPKSGGAVCGGAENVEFENLEAQPEAQPTPKKRNRRKERSRKKK